MAVPVGRNSFSGTAFRRLEKNPSGSEQSHRFVDH